MKILIAGGTGTIGRALARYFHSMGWDIAILTRRASRQSQEGFRYVPWDGITLGEWTKEIRDADIVANFTGKSIFTYWTARVKQQLLESRILPTRTIVEAIRRYGEKPITFFSASAIGYYGNTGDQTCDESCPAGSDFLAQLCAAWEEEARAAESDTVRVIIPRIGIVLDAESGFFALVRRAYSFWMTAYPGPGTQWLSWIHINDVVRSLNFLYQRKDFSGVYNAVTPESVQIQEFVAILAKKIGRPAGFPIPSTFLRVLFQEASALLLSSQRIVPKVLQETAFPYQFPALEQAIDALLKAQ